MNLNLQVVKGGTGPDLLITGGVHGDEFEPMVAIRRLNNEIDTNRLKGQVTLVPVVNEGAFRRNHRCAEDGLDLARVCPGRQDGTVTEQTAHALSTLIRASDYYIDLHTGGTVYDILPLAGYSLHRNSKILDVQRRMAQAFNLPVIWGTSPTLDGRSLSVARDADIPAIYCEYRGGAQCRAEGVEAYVEGCLNVMAALGMYERERPTSKVEHIVEDSRDQSGHLQINNPAPFDGYFEPAAALGDDIRKGDSLGTVVDAIGVRREEIRAQHDGIVLMTRTFPHVAEGESVGVILETES